MDARQTGGGVSSGTMCIGARIDIDMGRPNNESIAGGCNGLREWSLCRVQHARHGLLRPANIGSDGCESRRIIGKRDWQCECVGRWAMSVTTTKKTGCHSTCEVERVI